MFKGSDDFHIFFSYFENVAMRGGKKKETAMEFLSYLVGSTFQCSYDNTERERTVTRERKTSEVVKSALQQSI